MFRKVEESRLANGMRVITSQIDHVESVAIGLWVGAGSRHEPRKLGGVSHFLEHMLFKGTARRSALEISRTVEGRGGHMNAFTQEESTCYFARVGYDQFGTAFDVLSDMLVHARCSEADTAREKQVILEEMRMYADQPQSVVQDALQQAVWPRHPLGRPVIGTAETVGGMTAADLHSYRQQKYVPSRLVAAFAGKVDPAKCYALVERAFGSMPAGRKPRVTPFPAETAPVRVTRLAREIEQAHLALGVRVFGRQDDRRHILRLLSVILGGNMSSRLFQVVREKHGLAYAIHAGLQLQQETGVLHVEAGLDRNRGGKALRLIVREMMRMAETPVKKAELKRAKDFVVGQLRLALENTSSQMMWMGDNLLAYDHFVDPSETIENVQSVTADDIRDLAAESFRASRMSISAVTPMDPSCLPATELAAGLEGMPH